MHFPDLSYHTRSRTKSVQFDKVKIASGESVEDSALPPVRPASVAGPPIPGNRISSLPGNQQENLGSIRRYKSMLDVEEPPRLPVTQPLTYEELYPQPPPERKPTITARMNSILHVAKRRKASHSQPPPACVAVYRTLLWGNHLFVNYRG